MKTDRHGLFKLKSAFVRIFLPCLILFLLCFFAADSFGQETVLTQKQIDWIAESMVLDKAVQSGEIEQKREALRVIRNLKSAEASRIALPALKDKSEIVRATAASSVIFLPPDEAARAILPLLNDKNEFVRKEAAYALGKTRSPIAVAPLITSLQKDKKSEVKSAAIIALGEIGDASAVEVLTRVLQTNRKREEEFLRRSAARSIGQIAQMIRTGAVKVVTPESFVAETNRVAQMPKYSRLTDFFPIFRDANKVLIQTLQNTRETDDVRRETAFALGAIGDESALPVLRADFNSEDYYLAQICREAARKILDNQSLTDAPR